MITASETISIPRTLPPGGSDTHRVELIDGGARIDGALYRLIRTDRPESVLDAMQIYQRARCSLCGERVWETCPDGIPWTCSLCG